MDATRLAATAFTSLLRWCSRPQHLSLQQFAFSASVSATRVLPVPSALFVCCHGRVYVSVCVGM
eukprot:5045130-Pleurochrysis_carterae.AAC.1